MKTLMNGIPTEVDVLVVGLGPVGATLSCLLGRYGISTLAIDRAGSVLTHPRAIALDNEALRILQLAGLKEGAFATVPIPFVRMLSPDLGEFGRMNTNGETDGHRKLVTFYQPELEAALRASLSGHACVAVCLATRLVTLSEDAAGVQAVLVDDAGAGRAIRAKYVVGADGASSFVRQALGLGFEGHTYGEDWLIVDARGVREPIDHVEFLCDPARPTPHMVAPGGRQRWEFMLAPGETREAMEHPDKIRELLAPWGRPEEMIIERTAVYRFHARVVSRFSVGRVFLAGDAAHVTPPFAGQGLVAGLRDASNLAWKLAWVLSGRAAGSILESYDVERRPHARAMIRLARHMGRLIMPTNRLRAGVTHGMVKSMRLLPPVRALFDDMKAKPESRFRRGLFARGRGGSALRRGSLLPQGRVRSPDGAVCLSDDAVGPHLAIIGFGADPAAFLDAESASAFLAAGGRCVQIHASGQRSKAAGKMGDSARAATMSPAWEALDGVLVPEGAPPGWAAIVRPDRVVLHDGPVEEASRLVRETLLLLGAKGATLRSRSVHRSKEREPMIQLTTPQPARHPAPTAKADALAFITFERPDLPLATRFLTDFGLRLAEARPDALYFRGADTGPFCVVVRQGARPRFTGIGLHVRAEADLVALSEAGGEGVGSLDAPGGGKVVRLVDPSGFVVEAVTGQSGATALSHREPLVLNNGIAQPRVNATQRPPVEPSAVLRLGHVVLEAAAFQATCAWYTRHFGLIPSDVQVLPDGSPAVVFLRLDQGDTPVDHHTLAIAQGIAPAYGHSAYELVDMDAVAMGGRFLAERDWTHAWGVGRHILGSQIFDYWCDPWGDKHEHYTDGDLVTSEVPMGVHPVSREAMAQWGPPMPRSFTRPKVSSKLIAEMVRNVRTTPDLSVDKLLTLKRLFG
ncbi:MAG TPA: bifunctional 3-(3-hydroxy-phenyl)propionate/3-hydroxycinnamic acid hydroxylase [Polyangiaceae bacterium]